MEDVGATARVARESGRCKTCSLRLWVITRSNYLNTLISPRHLIGEYLDVVAVVMEGEGASTFPEAKQSHPATQRLLVASLLLGNLRKSTACGVTLVPASSSVMNF